MSNRKTAEKIRNLHASQEYEEAYQIAIRTLKPEGDNTEILAALREIKDVLFRRCMDLAHNKATEFSPELKEKEALLRKLKALMGKFE